MLKPGRPISLSSKPGQKTESQAVEEWSLAASLMVKRAMRERDWSYQELSNALSLLGIKRSATAINRRINRGNFTAGFLLACLHVLQATEKAEKL